MSDRKNRDEKYKLKENKKDDLEVIIDTNLLEDVELDFVPPLDVENDDFSAFVAEDTSEIGNDFVDVADDFSIDNISAVGDDEFGLDIDDNLVSNSRVRDREELSNGRDDTAGTQRNVRPRVESSADTYFQDMVSEERDASNNKGISPRK